jgi:hypothetical protein
LSRERGGPDPDGLGSKVSEGVDTLSNKMKTFDLALIIKQFELEDPLEE